MTDAKLDQHAVRALHNAAEMYRYDAAGLEGVGLACVNGSLAARRAMGGLAHRYPFQSLSLRRGARLVSALINHSFSGTTRSTRPRRTSSRKMESSPGRG